MILTQDEALIRISERVAENKKRIDRSLKQRRNQVVDMYGVEYTRQGGTGVPARFYISISPDMVYLERFEFKLIISPFLSTVGPRTGMTKLSLDVSGSLDAVTDAEIDAMWAASSCNDYSDDGEITITGGITPNPHDHTLDIGAHQVSTTASDFRVSVEGIDVTPYLMAQYGGDWINGEGIYPSIRIGDDYDILEVASDLIGEGRGADADKLIKSGYKLVEITSGAPFTATLVNYLKYSHLNR